MTALFQIDSGSLKPARRKALDRESMIENWVAADPALLGIDAMIIGQQVRTDSGGIIDLLALDRSGGVVIIELKKDRTPREIVAQVLASASRTPSLSV